MMDPTGRNPKRDFGAEGSPDEAARIAGLVEANIDWLRGWLRGRIGDRDAADDLCQESFLKALRRFPLLRDPSRFPAWLHRIAENTLRDHLRSEARRRARVATVEVFAVEPAAPAEDPGTSEEAGQLLEAIRALPPKLRDPLLLRHSRDLSYKEIAGILGIRENTVQVRIFRARRLLRKRLGREDARTELPPPGGGGSR